MNRVGSSGSSAPARILIPLLATFLMIPAAAAARIPVLEPIPWDAADSPDSFSFTVERFDDGDSGWSADRIGMRLVRRAGTAARFFLRFGFASFSSEGLYALERWPDLAGEEAGDRWPGESRVSGWSQPGVGVVSAADLPLLGRGLFALSLDMPLGKDELYPFGGRSIPVQIHLRKTVDLPGEWGADFGAGIVLGGGSPGDALSGDAFPGLTAWGGSIGWRGNDGRRLAVRADLLDGGGAESQAVGMSWTMPSGGRGRFTVAAAREFADAGQRAWGTRISVAWTILSAPAPDPQAQPSAEVPNR